ncbi:MAG TPA: NYN domain-containing protein [Clostridia bacterium]
MPDDIKIALLIDGENVSYRYMKTILDELSVYGIVTYKRVYGDFTKPSMEGWKSVLLDNALMPIQQFNNAVGKNSADSALIIDAMDILYSGSVGGFCIVSSDSDFTKLIARLRESGMFVITMGEEKTPKSLRKVSDKFISLDLIYDATKEEEKSDKNKKPEKELKSRAKQKRSIDPEIIRDIYKILIEDTDEEWLNLSELKNRLVKLHSDFDNRNYGYDKFSYMIKDIPDIEINERAGEGNIKIIYVRKKNKNDWI